ncbi:MULTISPECIES: GNAT family N-acetyltransferase [Syntrophotalea]|jgi:ribosomal protein S18 acetylase RimI-like enzyme/anti-sigma regulatory factor (Ser/Thr protein kinase)|uniref:Histidine kinase n=1 Tax=Syntrophotalea acetylenica TaxID=29542 RepID=A0A1L3GD23_SYNAC|nr:GNAT family N-acetyltransferase [Syntrophotalea acetylenica]APG23598.1 histidine kinase [Syntrophotalea acetylenica]APG44175.1 histidine kinase [Syntrophotalea acetylenica]
MDEVATNDFTYIRCLTIEDQNKIKKIPFLNIDSILIPSPFIKDKFLEIDYEHSYVWDEEGEFLGYILVYSNPDKTKFQVYKQVTSPFGRGKGIGSTFIRKLAKDVPGESYIYLFVWEKLVSTIDFFYSNGFNLEESTVYRKMRFYLMSATAKSILEKGISLKDKDVSVLEELSKVRHDAKKSLKVLSDMVSIMSVDNFNNIIEDINRENTALLNTLSMYEDKIKASHEVNIKEILTNRVIPFIEASNVPCEVRLVLGASIPPVIGGYMDYSRALINLTSNAIDAIEEAGRSGLIQIMITRKEGKVVLIIQDNGVGIGAERLQLDNRNLPLFVGKTTKADRAGEGVGTRQVFSTFGAGNIKVESREGKFTRWTITLNISTKKKTDRLGLLETRFIGFMKATETLELSDKSGRTEVASLIWHLRRMEIFSYDLIQSFSNYNNVRDIFKLILTYRYGKTSFKQIKEEIEKYRVDHEIIKFWLLGMINRIKKNEKFLLNTYDFEDYKGIYFKSYGQAINKTIIFTLDPDTGNFYAADRRLAEHLDFVPLLNRKRDQLIRGEFKGDVKNIDSPIYLGVWTVADKDDLYGKIVLLQQGCRQLLAMGIKPEKAIAFYHVTRNMSSFDFDPFKIIPLGELATLARKNFDQLITATDDDFDGLVFTD